MATSERTELIPARLPYPAEAAKYGYSEDVWRVLTEAIFPNAQSQHSVTLALAYCKARNLDIMKRPIHIVPIWDNKRKAYVETIWPGIGELRTTAARTGKYAGKDDTAFGPMLTENLGGVTVTFPEWAQVTVYKIVEGVRCPFVGPKVYWKETYATKAHDSDAPNTMWNNRPSGQLEKCAEAAGLRVAFPEEIGNDYSAEEMEGRKFESFARTAEGHDLGKAPPRRKSETAAAAPAAETHQEAPAQESQTQAAPPPAPAPSQNGNVWSGRIKACAVKKRGTSKDKQTGKDKPYTIFSVTGEDGSVFETFSDTQAELATSVVGQDARLEIHFATDNYGNKIKTIAPVLSTDREPGVEG